MLQRSSAKTSSSSSWLLPTMTTTTTIVTVAPIQTESFRFMRERQFNMLARAHKRNHSQITLNSHNSNFFGGRLSAFRYEGRSSHLKKGPEFTKHMPTMQYNIDVWSAQQSLRKKWKGRNWRVVEMPFEKAPKVLQRVIPEQYTELPVMADPANGDYSNIRRKTFSQEELQEALFERQVLPMPVVRNVSKVTLDSFFSDSASAAAPR